MQRAASLLRPVSGRSWSLLGDCPSRISWRNRIRLSIVARSVRTPVTDTLTQRSHADRIRMLPSQPRVVGFWSADRVRRSPGLRNRSPSTVRPGNAVAVDAAENRCFTVP